MARILEIPHGDTIEKTLMLFTQTNRLVNKYIDAYFYKNAPLSFTKFLLIKVLASGNGVMTLSQIAVWTQTELHNIITLVARLKKENLVYTERSNVDKRKVNIILTDKGRKALREALPIASELIGRIMSSITEADTLKLSQILEVLRDNAYDGLENINIDA